MAYQTRNLSVVAYANGFTLWHYKTTDDSISKPGYFNDASDMLRAGDIVLVNLGEENIRSIIIHIETNDCGEVTIRDLSLDTDKPTD